MNLNDTYVNIDLARLTTPQLVELFNRHSTQAVKRFADRKTAEKRVAALLEQLKANAPRAAAIRQRATPPAPAAAPSAGASVKRVALAESLKLDRRVVLLNTGEVWPNAYRLWCAYPESMTSAQQDRLTQRLYTAAKAGQREYVRINGLTYCLLTVPGQGELTAEVLEEAKSVAEVARRLYQADPANRSAKVS